MIEAADLRGIFFKAKKTEGRINKKKKEKNWWDKWEKREINGSKFRKKWRKIDKKEKKIAKNRGKTGFEKNR